MEVVKDWTLIILGSLGFLVTWTMNVISVTRAINRVKTDTKDTLDNELKVFDKRLTEAAEKRDDEQRKQDLRIHTAELFVRDNYVLKQDFLGALQKLENMLTKTTDEIKRDINDLANRLLHRKD